MSISYTPTTWADGADGGTPITAARLNNIESGVTNAVKQANANAESIKTLGDSVSQGAKVQTKFLYNSSDGYVAIELKSGIATLAWDFNKATISAWNIGSVPERCRPVSHTYTAQSVPYKGNTPYDHMGGYMVVSTSGQVSFVPAYADGDVYQCGCMSWPVA